MFYIAWDNELYYKNLVKSKKAPNTIVFYQSDWNDYGYYLTYTVCYYDQSLNETLLGNYRIYNKSIEDQINEFGIKKIFTQIHSDMSDGKFYNYDDSRNFEGINCNYYSLAQDISFYQHLYTLGTGCYENFLKEFRDLTVMDLPDDIKENEGVKKALLRNDGVTKSEDIIKLERHLKEIDERLNVGNFQKDNSIKIIAKKFIEDNGFEDVEAKIELHVIYKDIFAHLEEEDRLIKKYFTNDFQEIWQRVKRYDAVNHKGEIGCIDYNIFTQDQDPNSKDYIEVQNVVLSKNEKGKLKATAKVEIIDPAGPIHKEVDIILMKKGSKWRIDDIVSINGGSLKSTMKNYLINDPNY